MKDKKLRVDGGRVYLRLLTIEDATPEYLSWLNNSETNKYLETRSETMEGLKKYLRVRIDRDDIFFAGIFDKESNLHIGNVQMELIEEDGVKRGALGILIGNSEFRGKGIGTEVTKLITNYAFENLGRNEIWLNVISENLAGVKAYKKAGFKVVRIYKDDFNHDGVLFDRINMSIKKDEKK